MRTTTSLSVLAAVLSLTGCSELFTTTVEFSDETATAVDLEFDITGDCGDSGERIDQHGTTRWTETPLGEGADAQCRIDVTWDGDLISLAKMRADAVDECGADGDHCDPLELDLALEVRLDEAWFDAGPERLARAALAELTGRATTGGAVLFQLDRDTALPIQLAPDPAVAGQLQAAYQAGGALPVHAEGAVTLTMADVRRLQEAASTGTLHVGFTARLVGTIDAHL